MLPATKESPRAVRNTVKRQDEKIVNRVAAAIARKKSQNLQKQLGDEYDPACPAPFFPDVCQLLKHSENMTYHLVPYLDPECDPKNAEMPNSKNKYAYVCIFNEKTKALEFRVGSNSNGINVHLTLSGNAPAVVCAGELHFSDKGELLKWNVQSSSYCPTIDDANSIGLPIGLFHDFENDDDRSPLQRRSSPALLEHVQHSPGELAADSLARLLSNIRTGEASEAAENNESKFERSMTP